MFIYSSTFEPAKWDVPFTQLFNVLCFILYFSYQDLIRQLVSSFYKTFGE